ncbi:uncharacterized protein LOC129968225 [Argiope bruennichi]|uniref:uncharacterized protein LOC129968225 n=1 Tax=Argiope bruennichi TaxID=94029 RepID=UPI0024954BDC|nr:uncharacterized protein LOC129968225 [Argiope bruennichi]
MGAQIHDKFILLWLLTFLSLGRSDIFDWRDHMEDAFADEGHTDGTCKRNFNDKIIFCRYHAEDNKSLSTWQPCLCTHILITAELHERKINVPHLITSTDRDQKIIASISVDGNDKLNASSDFQQLLSVLLDSPINGIDIRLENSALEDGAFKSKIFKYIQDIVSLLRTEAKFQILTITMTRNMLTFLHDLQFLKIASHFDFLSFVPPLSHPVSGGFEEEYFTDIV